MAVDPSKIVLPPEEPDFRLYEGPWPDALVADDLDVSDYLSRSERHSESITAPDETYGPSWRVDAHAAWLLKDGEFIANYLIEEGSTRALLGTYLAPEVPLAVTDRNGSVKKYRSVSLWIHAESFKGNGFVLRISSNSLTIAVAEIDPEAHDQISDDGRWRRVVSPFARERMEETIKNREYGNRIDLIVERPEGSAALGGTIHVKGVQLHVGTVGEVSRGRAEAARPTVWCLDRSTSQRAALSGPA
jgi:hypothetical protein